VLTRSAKFLAASISFDRGADAGNKTSGKRRSTQEVAPSKRHKSVPDVTTESTGARPRARRSQASLATSSRSLAHPPQPSSQPQPPAPPVSLTSAPSQPQPPAAPASPTSAPSQPQPPAAPASPTSAPSQPQPPAAPASPTSAPSQPQPPAAPASLTPAPGPSLRRRRASQLSLRRHPFGGDTMRAAIRNVPGADDTRAPRPSDVASAVIAPDFVDCRQVNIY
jgi:hypothetical protein